MVRDRKRGPPDSDNSPSGNLTRDDDETQGRRERVPTRLQVHPGTGLPGILGGVGGLLPSNGGMAQRLPTNPAFLLAQSFSGRGPSAASELFRPAGTNGSINQLERLHYLLASGTSMPINALNSRIGVMRNPTMVPLGSPSRSLVPFPPLASMASQLRSSDVPAGLTAKQVTTVQPIRNSDSARKEALRLPCRARGMSPGHDVQNAHFTITPDTRHGEELICSHSGCREDGIKFCYCAYCQTPGAKRNFRIRHHHFEETPLPTAGSEVYERWQQTQEKTEGLTKAADVRHGSPLQAASVVPRDIGTNKKKSKTHAPTAQTIKAKDSVLKALPGAEVGTIKVPCPSKKMPYSHNSRSANFTISNDTKHGKEMICSHQYCREGGVKFLFCSFCKIPVAMRKFKIHHSHLENSSSPSPSTDTEADGKTKMVGNHSRSPPPSQVEAWNRLLETRPRKNDGEALAKWIEDVFTVSSRQTDDPDGIPDLPDVSIISQMAFSALEQDESATESTSRSIEGSRESSEDNGV